jgi:MoxR-like ATPase
MATPEKEGKKITLRNILIDNSCSLYSPPDELIQATEVAYALKKPLLISGEPGTGKTDFASWAAESLSLTDNFSSRPLVYNTKSTSVAQDLFYFYDVVSHFKGNSLSRSRAIDRATEEFIKLKDLGLAFANAIGKRSQQEGEKFAGFRINQIVARNSGVEETAQGSVVLIDEIDKAPRDFPNDLLNELDKYEFEIRELNEKIRLRKEEKEKILIILTTNIERNLPEPFLRRCVYYHIPFPDPLRMKEIIIKRLRLDKAGQETIAQVETRIGEFFSFREDPNIQKKPTTSEAIDYVGALLADDKLKQSLFDGSGKVSGETLRYLSLLLKKREDRELYVAP